MESAVAVGSHEKRGFFSTKAPFGTPKGIEQILNTGGIKKRFGSRSNSPGNIFVNSYEVPLNVAPVLRVQTQTPKSFLNYRREERFMSLVASRDFLSKQ